MKKSEIYQLAIMACISGLTVKSDADAFEVFDELFAQLHKARKAEETTEANTDNTPIPGPCPECGRYELAVHHCTEGYRVYCIHCGLSGRKLQPTAKEAIETWNWHEGGGRR